MVARDIVLPVDPETAWEAVRDPDWLGEPERELVVEEEVPGERLTWWWESSEGVASRVEIELVPVVGGTRVAVRESVAGPLCLA